MITTKKKKEKCLQNDVDEGQKYPLISKKSRMNSVTAPKEGLGRSNSEILI